ncbi:MAG: flagellar biosynthesis protein FlhF [Bdellovibrio sp.]
MYVKKFEAETMEEALKSIKQELGPDAIILKTVNNKGIKGAFKKKIEITAAISEKNYVKKARVDQKLPAEQKERFYQAPSSYIANMIDQHESHLPQNERVERVPSVGYGNAGLNKSVQSVKNIGHKMIASLDEFLGTGAGNLVENHDFDANEILNSREVRRETNNENLVRPQRQTDPQFEAMAEREEVKLSASFNESQQRKIEDLERKVYELTKMVERIERPEPIGVYKLRTVLRSLEINEIYTQGLVKQAVFELSKEELMTEEAPFELALKDMINQIKTDIPLFSKEEASDRPVIELFISETSSGQTTMIQKIAALRKNSVLVRYDKNGAQANQQNLAEKMYNMQVVVVQSIPEIVSATRKAVEQGMTILIDYKNNTNDVNETKQLVEGLKRAFDNVEILLCLSSIHAEIYNLKMCKRYQSLANGIVLTHLDQCLNFGSLFNLSFEVAKLPYIFFGTGPTVPEDIEAATAERILAGMFDFI